MSKDFEYGTITDPHRRRSHIRDFFGDSQALPPLPFRQGYGHLR